MSAFKSNMPSGTRQAALVALCLAACLLAWRGTSLLTSDPGTPAAAAVPADMQGLQALIDARLRKSQAETAQWAADEAATGAPPEDSSRFEKVFKSDSGQEFAYNYTAKNLKSDES